MEEQETEFPIIPEQCFTTNTATLPITPAEGGIEAVECATPSEETANSVCTVRVSDSNKAKIFPDAADVADATVDTNDNPSKLKGVPCEDVDKLQIISDMGQSVAEAATTAKICDESPLQLEVEAPNNYTNVAIKEELLSSDEDELFVFEGGTYTSVKMEPNIKTEEVDLKEEVVNRNFECPQCHKTFYLECLYLYHMISHEGVKPLTCTLCGFKCNKRLRMLAHLRRHTGEKKKPCKICGEYYYYWQDFEHYQNCPKPTPYNCSICDYGTRDRYRYLRHVRLHTGERPYKCRRCGSGFIDTVSQRKHFKTHLKEKLFQCHICHKRFKLPQNRENHVISFSSKKCPKCDYVCINCEDYYLHIKQFHGQSKLKIKLDRFFRELAQYSMSVQQNFPMNQQFSMEQQFPIEEKFSVEQQFPIEEKFSVEQQFAIEEQFSTEQQFPIEPEIVYDLPQNIKYEYASEADNLRTVMYINLG